MWVCVCVYFFLMLLCLDKNCVNVFVSPVNDEFLSPFGTDNEAYLILSYLKYEPYTLQKTLCISTINTFMNPLFETQKGGTVLIEFVLKEW